MSSYTVLLLEMNGHLSVRIVHSQWPWHKLRLMLTASWWLSWQRHILHTMHAVDVTVRAYMLLMWTILQQWTHPHLAVPDVPQSEQVKITCILAKVLFIWSPQTISLETDESHTGAVEYIWEAWPQGSNTVSIVWIESLSMVCSHLWKVVICGKTYFFTAVLLLPNQMVVQLQSSLPLPFYSFLWT